MSKFGKLLALSAAAAALAAGSAATAGPWGQHHPRRAEVNRRLENQGDRIQAGVRSGQLSPLEAHQLHQEDHTIRSEERSMARLDGGHITKADQRLLNHQENQTSEQIYDERH